MITKEVGLTDKKEKVFGEPEITCLSNSLIDQVDIKYILPIILLLLYGCVVSLLVLGVEIIWSKVEQNKLSRVTIYKH